MLERQSKEQQKTAGAIKIFKNAKINMSNDYCSVSLSPRSIVGLSSINLTRSRKCPDVDLLTLWHDPLITLNIDLSHQIGQGVKVPSHIQGVYSGLASPGRANCKEIRNKAIAIKTPLLACVCIGRNGTLRDVNIFIKILKNGPYACVYIQERQSQNLYYTITPLVVSFQNHFYIIKTFPSHAYLKR